MHGLRNEVELALAVLSTLREGEHHQVLYVTCPPPGLVYPSNTLENIDFCLSHWVGDSPVGLNGFPNVGCLSVKI